MIKEISQKKIEAIKKLPINSVDEAEVVASILFDILNPRADQNHEQAFFVAGFLKCYKFFNN
jgi:hypothetical protein